MTGNIVLIGFMGCGKTSVGKRLAKECTMEFLDSDECLELENKMSVSEMFGLGGEALFRNKETELLKKLNSRTKAFVLSTGGGMPMVQGNDKLLRELGTVIYLSARPETIYDRLKDDDTRPLLRCEDKLARIQDILSMRHNVYCQCADIIIEVDNRNIDEIIEMIEEHCR